MSDLAICALCGAPLREMSEARVEKTHAVNGRECQALARERERREAYLGDGVYAIWDGYTIWLDLRGQDDFTRIALEPEVLIALDRFRERPRALSPQPGDLERDV